VPSGLHHPAQALLNATMVGEELCKIISLSFVELCGQLGDFNPLFYRKLYEVLVDLIVKGETRVFIAVRVEKVDFELPAFEVGLSEEIHCHKSSLHVVIADFSAEFATVLIQCESFDRADQRKVFFDLRLWRLIPDVAYIHKGL
jgi:hypothetical protein